MSDPIIKPIVINQELVLNSLYNRYNEYPVIPTTSSEAPLNTDAVPKDIFEFYDKMDQDEGTETIAKSKAVQLEIYKDQIETLQKRLIIYLCNSNELHYLKNEKF